MLRKRLIPLTGMALIVMLGLMIVPAQGATNTLPLTPEFWFQTSTFNAYSKDYTLQDYLIGSDGIIDMSFIAGLTAVKTHASVNFANGATVLESDSYFDDNIISPTFMNNTFNAGVASSATVVNEFATASKTTIGTASAKTSGAGGNAYWKFQAAWDANGDGDYADPTDKSHYPLIDSSAVFFYNARYHINASDATAYAELAFVFATTGSDYTIRVRFHETSGDAAWTDLDSTGENAATLNYYDTNYTSICGFLPVAEILDADAGDSPDLSGLKEGKITVYGGADKLHTVSAYNMAVLTQKPAFSDRDDEDKDFDIDAAAIFSSFIWDDTDFLATKVTEAATDSFDNTMPLAFDLETGFIPLVKFRKLQITGEFSCPPTYHKYVESVLVGSSYKTKLLMEFTTTGLNAFTGTASDYFSWTNVQFNVTLNDKDLPGTYQTFEDQLISFKVDGLEKEPTFDDAWDVTKDNVEVSFDLSDPSTTTGSKQEVIMLFMTKSYYSGEGGAGQPSTDNTFLMVVTVVVVVIVFGGVVIFVAKRKKDTGSIFG